MARVEGSYPPPVQGVSTLAPRNRPSGFAGLQENLRSDPIRKLTRRPPTEWIKHLKDVTAENSDLQFHSYRRRGQDFLLILDTSGIVPKMYGFVDGEEVPVNGEVLLDSYSIGGLIQNAQFSTINDTTFLANPNIFTRMVGTTESASIEKVSYLNVTSALNYGETVTVKVSRAGVELGSVSYTVPDLGVTNPDYDTADKARATKRVAQELALLINSGPITYPNPNYNYTWQVCSPVIIPLDSIYDSNEDKHGYAKNTSYDAGATECQPYITSAGGIADVTAIQLGSNVAIWSNRFGGIEWLDVSVETGQGDRSVTAINGVVESIEGLPLYAVHGTRITIKPDPRSEKGTYYLEAVGTADGAVQAPTINDRILQEVTWVEARSPTEPYIINESTMPRAIVYELGEFTVTHTPAASGRWDDREVGDDNSVPPPGFIDSTIKSIGHFQNRLVLVSGDSVYMSETDNLYNWWKGSALQLLVSDPVSLASSAVGIDELTHVLPHNRDLLVFAGNAQFKVDGSQAITPQTGALQLTTSYESQEEVPPVSMGNSIMFAIDYGDSSGIQEFTGEQNTTQDVANQLTRHVVGYLDGTCTQLVGSPNLGMLVLRTDQSADNVLFVLEQNQNRSGKVLQAAWSKWTLPTNSQILHMFFRNDSLQLIAREGSNIVLKSINLYSRTTTSSAEIFLDDLVPLASNGTTATLPIGYTYDSEVIAVQGEGCDYALSKAPFTINGSLLTFDEDISSGQPCTVYVGRPTTARYRPTRPFIYDEAGVAVTTDPIRISKYLLDLVDTGDVSMQIDSPYYTAEDQNFNARYVGGINNLVGQVPLYTGEFSFSYGQDAALADVEFYTDSWLGLTIAGISWLGQYHKTSRRV